MLNGIDPKNNEFYIAFIGQRAAAGAKQNEDGVSATVCIGAAIPITARPSSLDRVSVPDRKLRTARGLWQRRRISRRAWLRKYRAGTRRFHAQRTGRTHALQALGLNGGKEATGNAVVLRAGGTWKEDYPNAKLLTATSSRAMLSQCALAGAGLRRSAQTAGRNRRGRCASGISWSNPREKTTPSCATPGQPGRRCDRKATSRQLTKSVQR